MSVALAIGAGLLAAPSANAATVGDTSDPGTWLVFTAAAGEVNDLEVGSTPSGAVRFEDGGAAVTPGAGCNTVDTNTVDCELPPDQVAVVEIRPGDSDDTINGTGLDPERIASFDVREETELSGDDTIVTYEAVTGPGFAENGGGFIYGGGGDDQITLLGSAIDARIGPSAYVVNGGTGRDVIDGSAGEDEIWGDQGRDEVHAGPGPDFVLSSEQVDAGGGRDRVRGGEVVRGGSGIDILFGRKVFGGEGNDYIEGFRDASSVMHGGEGNDDFELHSQDEGRAPDAVFGDAGRDTVAYNFCGRCAVSLDGRANDGFVSRAGRPEGDNIRAEIVEVSSVNNNPRFDTVFGPGDDVIHGDREDNRFYTGHGPDLIDPKGGEDVVRSWHGDDVIDARDGEVDRIICGRDRDRVLADPNDRVRSDCEDVRVR